MFVISIAAIIEKISSIPREQNKQHKITFYGLKQDFWQFVVLCITPKQKKKELLFLQIIIYKINWEREN